MRYNGGMELLILCVYFITHLLGLTSLPVFADESIYIRWAQLIIDDSSRYLFFAMNDGKTPLYIWGLVPWQYLFSDQLWAGRWWSVVAGLLQVSLLGYATHLLGGKKGTRWLAMALGTALPFWFFHHRIALMDAWLTVGVTTTLISIVHLTKATKKVWLWTLLTGLSWGLTLWIKLPAILLAPLFVFSILLPEKKSLQQRWQLAFKLALSGMIGLGLFGLLRLSPTFGQLFNRGSDFLYPWQTVILEGGWKQTLPNWPTYFSYFWHYLTWPVLIAALAGLFSGTHRRMHHWLWWSALGFGVPIALLGRVVYPRYLLPLAPFLTLSAVFTWQEWYYRWYLHQKKLWRQVGGALVLVLLFAQSLALSGVFMYQSWFDPDHLSLVKADQVQYLEEWSSGHGITATVKLIEDLGNRRPLAVATEGYFGTLPDALLMYLHRHPIPQLKLEGIGQPVTQIPANFWQTARDSQQVLLVVNSHRLEMSIDPRYLLLNECRPNGAPCLQVWDITHLRPQL